MACYFFPAGVRFNDYLFTDPVSFSGWRPPGCAGVVVTLARNPQWAPKPLQPLFFAEFGNNAGSGAITPRWKDEQRTPDVLIAVLPMPFSTVAQRRAVCKELIAAYNPAWQSHGFSTATTAELAFKVEELEARQQEQSQQILSLLTFIEKLFAPQPVAPRRPIGFLTNLPAVAGATESGS